MTLLPIASLKDGNSILTFEAIPFWTGVQQDPGVLRNLPFSLIATNESPIKQMASEQVMDDVVGAYHKDEYKFITPPPGSSDWATSLGENYIKDITGIIADESPKNILEIGGGSAWIACKLCECYQPDSYVIVDPAARPDEQCVELITDYFPSNSIVDRYFDLILGLNVLEHVPDPLSFLVGIRRQLTSNGKVILVYPDCESQLLQGDLNVLVHEHLSYFTEESSRYLTAIAGFSVAVLNRKNDTITIVLEIAPCSSSVKLNESQLLIKSAHSFYELLTLKCEIIRRTLDIGQFVGFHGATAGLNTFLYITGLGNHPNIRIYDGDAAKVSSYLPACYSCILSPYDKSYESNSLLVISAMTFFEEIKQFAIDKKVNNYLQIIPLIGC